jgi:hypothetical protein
VMIISARVERGTGGDYRGSGSRSVSRPRNPRPRISPHVAASGGGFGRFGPRFSAQLHS